MDMESTQDYVSLRDYHFVKFEIGFVTKPKREYLKEHSPLQIAHLWYFLQLNLNAE